MIPKDGLDIKYVLAALRRRFWYIVIPFFLVMMATVLHCIRAPRMYWSSSLLLVQPQEIPADYVNPTVTSDVYFRLRAITDEIMSRSRLEKIINEFDLYPEIRASGNIHDALGRLKRNIHVDPQESENQPNFTSFRVSFESGDPKIARDVTAALADLFITYNVKMRQDQAAGTSNFLEQELAKMEIELRRWEDKVRQFKEKHTGLLPEQMENNYRILAQLQQQLDSLNTTLQKTEDRKVFLQSRISKLESFQEGAINEVGSAASQTPRSLEELRRQLQMLKSRYSDRHPDVRKLARTIAKMEAEQNASIDRTDSDKLQFLDPTASQTQRFVNVQQEEVFAELKMIDKEINLLREEMKKTSAEIEEYRHRIETGPTIEAMFVDLRRGYEQASANYQSLLQKKLQAELSENLEHTQKGEQFKILDPAYFPWEPYKPEVRKLFKMGLVLGLVSGFGLAFLREYMDSTFWSRKEVESVLELPVLISVPRIETPKERRTRKVKLAAGVCVLLVMSSSLVYAMYLLWKKSPGFLPIPL